MAARGGTGVARQSRKSKQRPSSLRNISPNDGAGVLPSWSLRGRPMKDSSRFPFFTTVDQAKAIRDVLDDLAAGHPMDRVVCGDVGFGKTEVALRAAAAVALSGKQVAVAVPTTVLARQHVETVRKRFGPLGIEVANLSRASSSPEIRDTKEKLRRGR